MAYFKELLLKNVETEIFERETCILEEMETYAQARLFYKTPLEGEEWEGTKLEYYNTL